MLVISWLLEREYRQHRALDAELPTTYTKWLGSLNNRLQQDVTRKTSELSRWLFIRRRSKGGHVGRAAR